MDVYDGLSRKQIIIFIKLRTIIINNNNNNDNKNDNNKDNNNDKNNDNHNDKDVYRNNNRINTENPDDKAIKREDNKDKTTKDKTMKDNTTKDNENTGRFGSLVTWVAGKKDVFFEYFHRDAHQKNLNVASETSILKEFMEFQNSDGNKTRNMSRNSSKTENKKIMNDLVRKYRTSPSSSQSEQFSSFDLRYDDVTPIMLTKNIQSDFESSELKKKKRFTKKPKSVYRDESKENVRMVALVCEESGFKGEESGFKGEEFGFKGEDFGGFEVKHELTSQKRFLSEIELWSEMEEGRFVNDFNENNGIVASRSVFNLHPVSSRNWNFRGSRSEMNIKETQQIAPYHNLKFQISKTPGFSVTYTPASFISSRVFKNFSNEMCANRLINFKECLGDSTSFTSSYSSPNLCRTDIIGSYIDENRSKSCTSLYKNHENNQNIQRFSKDSHKFEICQNDNSFDNQLFSEFGPKYEEVLRFYSQKVQEIQQTTEYTKILCDTILNAVSNLKGENLETKKFCDKMRNDFNSNDKLYNIDNDFCGLKISKGDSFSYQFNEITSSRSTDESSQENNKNKRVKQTSLQKNKQKSKFIKYSAQINISKKTDQNENVFHDKNSTSRESQTSRICSTEKLKNEWNWAIGDEKGKNLHETGYFKSDSTPKKTINERKWQGFGCKRSHEDEYSFVSVGDKDLDMTQNNFEQENRNDSKKARILTNSSRKKPKFCTIGSQNNHNKTNFTEKPLTIKRKLIVPASKVYKKIKKDKNKTKSSFSQFQTKSKKDRSLNGRGAAFKSFERHALKKESSLSKAKTLKKATNFHNLEAGTFKANCYPDQKELFQSKVFKSPEHLDSSHDTLDSTWSTYHCDSSKWVYSSSDVSQEDVDGQKKQNFNDFEEVCRQNDLCSGNLSGDQYEMNHNSCLDDSTKKTFEKPKTFSKGFQRNYAYLHQLKIPKEKQHLDQIVDLDNKCITNLSLDSFLIKNLKFDPKEEQETILECPTENTEKPLVGDSIDQFFIDKTNCDGCVKEQNLLKEVEHSDVFPKDDKIKVEDNSIDLDTSKVKNDEIEKIGVEEESKSEFVEKKKDLSFKSDFENTTDVLDESDKIELIAQINNQTAIFEDNSSGKLADKNKTTEEPLEYASLHENSYSDLMKFSENNSFTEVKEIDTKSEDFIEILYQFDPLMLQDCPNHCDYLQLDTNNNSLTLNRRSFTDNITTMQSGNNPFGWSTVY